MKGDEFFNVYLFGFLMVPEDDGRLAPAFMLGFVPRHWCIGYEHRKGDPRALAFGPLRLFIGGAV